MFKLIYINPNRFVVHFLHLVLMMIIETCFQNLTDTIWSVSDENLKVKLSKNQVTKSVISDYQVTDVNKVKVELNHLHKSS